MKRIIVIGCGYWGPNLIRNFAHSTEWEVVGVADLDKKRLEHIQDLYPAVTITNNYHDLLEDKIDAVAIATPPETHYKIAQECLAHGLHVLVEKPITLNSVEAQHLIEIAEDCQRVLMVGHTFEYNSAVRTMKKIVNSGELGDIYYIDAVRVNLGLFQSELPPPEVVASEKP